MKLIQIDRDWADEFSIFGAKIISNKQYDLFRAAIKSVKDDTFSWFFGTNEGFDDITFGSFLDTIKAKEVSDEEAKTLVKFFPGLKKYGLGQFPCLEELFQNYGDEEWNDKKETDEIKAYHEFIDKEHL